MAFTVKLLTLLALVASCHCKPFGWGVGGGASVHSEVGADVGGEAAVGTEDGKLFAKGAVDGGAHGGVSGGLSNYAYVGNTREDGKATGFGVRNTIGADLGASAKKRIGAKVRVGKGDNLLSLKGDAGIFETVDAAAKANLGGDLHSMNSNELNHMLVNNKAYNYDYTNQNSQASRYW